MLLQRCVFESLRNCVAQLLVCICLCGVPYSEEAARGDRGTKKGSEVLQVCSPVGHKPKQVKSPGGEWQLEIHSGATREPRDGTELSPGQLLQIPELPLDEV